METEDVAKHCQILPVAGSATSWWWKAFDFSDPSVEPKLLLCQVRFQRVGRAVQGRVPRCGAGLSFLTRQLLAVSLSLSLYRFTWLSSAFSASRSPWWFTSTIEMIWPLLPAGRRWEGTLVHHSAQCGACWSSPPRNFGAGLSRLAMHEGNGESLAASAGWTTLAASLSPLQALASVLAVGHGTVILWWPLVSRMFP